MPASDDLEECFNCDGPATERYTLVFESGKIFEDKLMCDACVADFNVLDWIEVREAPVLMRGNEDSKE